MLKESATERMGVFVAAEALGEIGTVFHRLEMALGIRIVIGDVGSIERAGHAQTAKQTCHRVRRHRRASIAVDDQLVGFDVLFFKRRFDQLLGQVGTLAIGQHPPDHAAAVDVDDHVEVIICPFFPAFELRDVP